MGWEVDAYRGLEDAFISPVCLRGFLDFGFGGLGVHDAVLSGDLFAVAFLVARFLLAVLLQLLVEARFELVDLGVLDLVVFALHRIFLQRPDLVLDLGVEHLRLRDDRLQLL